MSPYTIYSLRAPFINNCHCKSPSPTPPTDYLTIQQLIDQVSCHRGKLRDHVRSLVKLYIDMEVRKAPPLIFRNLENGETLTSEEKPSTIMAQFISRLLDDFHFLDNFTLVGKAEVIFFQLSL